LKELQTNEEEVDDYDRGYESDDDSEAYGVEGMTL
jgi:hypothetical protein